MQMCYNQLNQPESTVLASPDKGAAQMIRIALCDDEQKVLDEVSFYINKYSQAKSSHRYDIFSFDSAKSLINALDDEKHFDIYILDIYIGDEIGTDLAKSLRKRGIDSPVIFLTTSIEHAPQSFETGTLRYLIKPLDPEKLYEAMDAASTQVEKMSERRIKFKTENGVESIAVNNIMYSESYGHYQYITIKDGEKIRVRNTVAELLAALGKYGGFVRVGSPYIINLRHVRNVSSAEVLLYDDVRIQIPRGKYTEIKNAFWDFHYEGGED